MDNIEGEKNPGDQKGMTPLHFAAECGQLEIVRLLIDKIDRENLNRADVICVTPLRYALRRGHLEIAQLLKDNIDPNNCEEGSIFHF